MSQNVLHTLINYTSQCPHEKSITFIFIFIVGKKLGVEKQQRITKQFNDRTGLEFTASENICSFPKYMDCYELHEGAGNSKNYLEVH